MPDYLRKKGLYLDDIQLVRQSNYVENGDFENQELGVTTSVDGFAYDSTFANNTIEITDDAISGEKALKITQNMNGEKAYNGTFYADGTFASASNITDVPAKSVSKKFVKFLTNSFKFYHFIKIAAHHSFSTM